MVFLGLKQTGGLHRVQGINIERQYHSILVRRKMPFEICLPEHEKLFRADSNPSTQISSGTINCMLKIYELALLFGAIGLLNL